MKQMSFADFAAIRNDETMRLVDVREEHEYQAVRVIGAELFPLSRFQRGERFELDDRELYVICRSGARSQVAIAMLEGDGAQECTNISDGTLGAISAGDEYLEKG